MRDERVRVIVEVGLTLALAAVLNALRLFSMPQGGTVSLVMLPLLVLALRRGVVIGIIAGALYGLLDLMIDPFVVHWAQLLLDYPIAYASVGLAGLFSPMWHRSFASAPRYRLVTYSIGAAVLFAAAARYAAHVVSGVVFFSSYAAGQPVLLYSMVYNAYVFVSAAVCFAAALILLPALEKAIPSNRDPR